MSNEEMPFVKPKKSVFYVEPNSSKTTIVVGKSKSGKTHFLVEELNKLVNQTREVDGITRPIFDLIVIFTESLNAEPFQKLDKNLPVIYFKGYVPKYVLLLKKINDETNNHFKFLCILDDCLGSVSGKSLRGGSFPKQMLTFRNAAISTIVCVQGVTLLEPKSRENAHQIIVTGLKIKDQIKVTNDLFYDSVVALFPEYSGKRTSKEEVAKRFFDKIGSNILLYDNLGHKSFLIQREAFTPS